MSIPDVRCMIVASTEDRVPIGRKRNGPDDGVLHSKAAPALVALRNPHTNQGIVRACDHRFSVRRKGDDPDRAGMSSEDAQGLSSFYVPQPGGSIRDTVQG